jgi:hypothetical protein
MGALLAGGYYNLSSTSTTKRRIPDRILSMCRKRKGRQHEKGCWEELGKGLEICEQNLYDRKDSERVMALC